MPEKSEINSTSNTITTTTTTTATTINRNADKNRNNSSTTISREQKNSEFIPTDQSNGANSSLAKSTQANRARANTVGYSIKPIQRTVINFFPGPIGIRCIRNQVTTVIEDSQAAILGIQVGWEIIQINDDSFSNGVDNLNEVLDHLHLNTTNTIVFQCSKDQWKPRKKHHRSLSTPSKLGFDSQTDFGKTASNESATSKFISDKFLSLKKKLDEDTKGETLKRLAKYKERLQSIEYRNYYKKVGKDFEGGYARIIIIMIITYIVLGFYMMFVGIGRPFINAIVPTVGFQLSTVSLKCLQHRYVAYQVKSQKKDPLLRLYLDYSF